MCDSLSNFKYFNYKGTVTGINSSVCQFTLDNRFKVYAEQLFKKSDIKLPKVQEEIIIRKGLLVSVDTVFLTENSLISCCNFSDLSAKSEANCRFFVQNGPFSLNDVQIIENNTKKFEMLDSLGLQYLNRINLVDISFREVIVLALLQFKSLTNNNFRDSIPEICLKCPYNLKFIDKTAKPSTKGPDYSFSIQQYQKTKSLLGYLSYNLEKNRITISDSKNDIICVVSDPNDTQNLSKCLNKLITITNYHIITENFRESKVRLQQYLYFDVSDARIINLTYNNPKIQPTNVLLPFICEVLHVGPIYFNYFRQIAECWVHAKHESFEFLFTSNGLLKLHPLITRDVKLSVNLPKVGNVNTFLNEKFRTEANIELNRVYPNIPHYVLPSQYTIAIVKNEDVVDNSLPFLEEVKKKMMTLGSTPISFIGIVQEKILKEPLASRTGQKYKNRQKYFGTLGSKTHVINLCGIHERSETVNIFLNNWEAIQGPLGLITGMKIAVRYVIPQRTYFKSCIFTKFEVIQYVPSMKFNTSYDLIENYDWGPSTLLGLGKKLPKNIVAWCTVSHVEIRTLKIRHKCVVCSQEAKKFQEFCCGQKEFKLHFMLTFYVLDSIGESVIITSNFDFLKEILNIQDGGWEMVLNVFEHLKFYDYVASNYQEKQKPKLRDDTEIQDVFQEALHVVLECQDFFEQHIDVKCRNMQSAEEYALWYGIELRKSNTDC